MPYSYDAQLIDASSVRRKRLVGALMFGPERLKRVWDDGVRGFLISGFLAVLLCAGCVAVSFVSHLLATDPSLKRNQRPAVTSGPASPPQSGRGVAPRTTAPTPPTSSTNGSNP